jgi:hypothetical protein
MESAVIPDKLFRYLIQLEVLMPGFISLATSP